ncbi:hypothetical protein RIR_jg19399.t1 [Rhizophagus irregularis DAOM 181602=DAOM 197198]|nr:hypothetical protein RIR_jg19399.t1 [Rhizophagus irregularis DAOM 181602=DAOM 197198]
MLLEPLEKQKTYLMKKIIGLNRPTWRFIHCSEYWPIGPKEFRTFTGNNIISENLKTLLHSDCDPSLREYYKAGELRTSLRNSKKDQVNIDLWQTYSTKLGKMAIENRVNKCEVLTTGIRAATGAVATEFPYDEL